MAIGRRRGAAPLPRPSQIWPEGEGEEEAGGRRLPARGGFPPSLPDLVRGGRGEAGGRWLGVDRRRRRRGEWSRRRLPSLLPDLAARRAVAAAATAGDGEGGGGAFVLIF